MRTSDLKNTYSAYLTHIKGKVSKYSAKLNQAIIDKEYLWEKIMSNESTYREAGIDIDNVTYANRKDFTTVTLRKHNLPQKDKAVLISYIVAYLNLRFIEKVCIDGIKKYEQMLIGFSLFSYLIKNINFELSKLILNGYPLDIGKGLGTIVIKEKERNFDSPSSMKSVNWGASNKLKQKLLDEGKTLYNAKTAPDGTKWHVPFTDKFSYWIMWFVQTRNVINSNFYKFIPTHFVNGDMRDKDTFDNVCVTKESILDNKELGMINKLYALIKLDPTHVLNYRKDHAL